MIKGWGTKKCLTQGKETKISDLSHLMKFECQGPPKNVIASWRRDSVVNVSVGIFGIAYRPCQLVLGSVIVNMGIAHNVLRQSRGHSVDKPPLISLPISPS